MASPELGGNLKLLLLFVLLGLSRCSSKKAACLHEPGEKVEISCPKGQVIMNPKVKVGKTGAEGNQRCKQNPKRDCFGKTPEVLAQTNNCHFLQVCSIVLNPMMPITSTENRSCLAKTPDYAILESHECICENSLKFICGVDTQDPSVRKYEGVLVSHQNYPWFYPKEPRRCQALFTRVKGHQLTLWSDDIHLDPDGRDNVSLYNISFPDNQKLIGEPINFAGQGLNETFIDTTVEVVFNINEHTKSGRGFVINYKWTLIHEVNKKSKGETEKCKPKKNTKKGRKSKGKSRKKGKKRKKGRKKNGRKRKGQKKKRKSNKNREGRKRNGHRRKRQKKTAKPKT